jgi:surfeit locus 1 family protein
MSKRFPVGLTIAVAICMAILIGLGAWQLQRLKWKEGLLAHIAALQNAPAQHIGPVLDAAANGKDVGFTRVRLVCPGLSTAPFLELYGLKDGQAGARIISACPTNNAHYPTILVDRGFVPDTVSARPPVEAKAECVDVTGVLRVPDKASWATPPNDVAKNKWYSRDAAAMARALKVSGPAPVFLMAETNTTPGFPALIPAPLPAEIPNRHLEYALTWFGLAGALAGVYAAMLFRKVRD